MPQTIPVSLGDRSYDVVVGSGLLNNAAESLRRVLGNSRLFVVFDESVAQPWADGLVNHLVRADFVVEQAAIPSGETSKRAAEIARLWELMAERGYTRDTAIVALGGGVVGDLAGFLAASFLRGLPFVQVPTTLLAMVDSSVGGKTGINLAAGKNLVGAFWQPALVLADLNTLSTLPVEETRSGMAEVIKYGVIRDREFFEFLETTAGNMSTEDTLHIVKRSVEIKADVVSGDERETSGLRAILNFGHTLGHAIEAEAGYSVLRHGEAISIGMVGASMLALEMKTGWTEHDHQRLTKLLTQTGLPTALPSPYSAERLLARTRVDKKAVSGQVRYILPTRLGHVEIFKTVSDASILRVLGELGASAQGKHDE